MANKAGVFERLIGLETEYALAISRSFSDFAGPAAGAKYRLFRQLANTVRQRVPAVDARHMKEGIFHAAGGAIWFETERPAAGGGLIEGATPECRSPRQLLAWQRAQDTLLASSLEQTFGDDVRLLKNDRDAHGNVYGAQENYEADIGTGWQLTAWRVSLVLVLPVVVATWILLWLLAAVVIVYTLFASLTYLLVEKLVARPQVIARALFGCEFSQLEHGCPTGPRWLEGVLAVVTRVVTLPLAIVFYGLLSLFAFRHLRRQLTPFLISRPVIAGAGMIDNDGNFHLADKAPAMNCLTGYGGLLADRPIFSMGHFFKTVYADAWLRPLEYLQLFQQRHRLQIALGDSNCAEVAEYLRIGTTLLVIDAIEAGHLPKAVRVRRPLKALRAICADVSLTYRISLVGGGSCTAIELQRSYLEACRSFLHECDNPPSEAWHLLRMWEDTLDALEVDPSDLVGTLDWVTKRFVLEKAGQGASWEVRKKIDLRYHELSPDGYFERLKTTGIAESVLEEAEIEYALRNPPANTPATVRGRYIREFAGGDEVILANWRQVFIGRGRQARTIDLNRYRQLNPKETKSASRRSRRRDQG